MYVWYLCVCVVCRIKKMFVYKLWHRICEIVWDLKTKP